MNTTDFQSRRQAGEIIVGRFKVPFIVYDPPSTRSRCIVCVNGALQGMAAWRSFVTEFRHDSRVVIFDFPGQGRAQCLTGADAVSLAEQRDILESVIAATADGQAVSVYGSSWGGLVAAAVAAHAPERISHLILGGVARTANGELAKIIDLAIAAIEANEPSGRGGPMIVESFGQRVPESMRRQIYAQFENMPVHHLRTIYGQLNRFLSFDATAEIDFRAIRAKTLFVAGACDPIVELHDVVEMSQLVNGSTVHLAAGLGHFLHWEDIGLLQIYRRFFSDDGVSEIAHPRQAAGQG